MDGSLDDKLRELRGLLASLSSALVSYSGGVDSTLLAYLARSEVRGEVLAVTLSSPLMPPREVRRALEVAGTLGIPVRVAETDELSLPGFRDNPRDRCYLCKKHRLLLLKGLAAAGGFACVLDGSQRDDGLQHRPGARALREEGALSPLALAGLGKDEVRRLARELGLPNWDAPPRPCLATRFPHGAELAPELMRRVDAAEEWLESTGLREYRVRLDGPAWARIEAARDELPLLLEKERGGELVKKFRELGFRRVDIDLEGYRSGSMEETGRRRKTLTLFGAENRRQR